MRRLRATATMADPDDETRLAALLDAEGVLALVVDETVDAPEDDVVEEARVVADKDLDAVEVAVEIASVNPPSAASEVVLAEAPPELALELALEPLPEPP